MFDNSLTIRHVSTHASTSVPYLFHVQPNRWNWRDRRFHDSRSRGARFGRGPSPRFAPGVHHLGDHMYGWGSDIHPICENGDHQCFVSENWESLSRQMYGLYHPPSHHNA
eukprot:2997829-Pyramimonas_sp.AAC.1